MFFVRWLCVVPFAFYSAILVTSAEAGETPASVQGKSQSRAQHSFSSKAGLFKINGPKQGPYQNTC
jgi:hypothetical protein